MSALRTSSEIPSIEPLEINAGDVAEWTRDLGADFPAATWTVTYHLRGIGSYAITTTGSGTIFTASAAPGTTANWLAGGYAMFGLAVSSTKRIQIYDGKLTIHPDPIQMPEGTDLRSHAKICLDAIEQVIQQRATRPESEYQIEGVGRHYIYKSDEQLTALRNYYLAEYDRELNADALRRGESVSKNIGARFSNPW